MRPWLFLSMIFLMSCGPQEFDPDFFNRAEKASTTEDRAYLLFLGAQVSYHLAQTLKDSQKDAALEKARGALLRVVELGKGPVTEARHNLRILFKDDPEALEEESKKDQDDLSKDLDLSDQVQELSEEERRIEELLQKDLSNRPMKGESLSPVPMQEDF